MPPLLAQSESIYFATMRSRHISDHSHIGGELASEWQFQVLSCGRDSCFGRPRYSIGPLPGPFLRPTRYDFALVVLRTRDFHVAACQLLAHFSTADAQNQADAFAKLDILVITVELAKHTVARMLLARGVKLEP